MSCHAMEGFGFAAILLAIYMPCIVAVWAGAKYGAKAPPENNAPDSEAQNG